MEQKLSNRQILRLYVFDLIGIATLLLPPYLAKLCGTGGVYAILLGAGFGFLYLAYLGWIRNRMKMDLLRFLHENVSTRARKIALTILLFHCIATAGFCAHIFANLMQYSLVESTSYGIVLLLILAGALYAVSGGIKRRARVYEVLFWVILLPYFAMMLASVRNVKWRYLTSFLEWEGDNLAKGTYFVFLMLTPLFFLLFLVQEEKRPNGCITKPIAKAMLIFAIVLLGSYVLLLGNFGAGSLSQLRFPVITLMSTIQFEGNFLKRMDAPMLAVWFFTLYALLNLHLHSGIAMLQGTENVSQREDNTKWWHLLLMATCVYLVAYLLSLEGNWMKGFLSYYAYVAVPLMIALPLFLMGCSSTELEERCFPMLVAVGFEDGKVSFGAGFSKENKTDMRAQNVFDIDFVKSKEKFQNRMNKNVDYNHLKMLVIEDDLLETPIAYSVMLANLAETESFPRNTYVCVVDDVEDLYELEKNISQDIGTYMEEYLKLHEEKKGRLLTLGDLIDEQQNQTAIVYLPYIDVEDNFVEWKGYVNTSGKIWQESK